MFNFPRALWFEVEPWDRSVPSSHSQVRNSRNGRRVGAVFLIAFWLVAFVAPQSSLASTYSAVTPAAVTAATCPSVIFIGARGSGEKDAYNIKDPITGKTIKRDSGLGPELDGLYDQMAGDLKNRLSVSPLFVVYTAASVDVLKLSTKEKVILAGIPLLGPGLIAQAYAAFAASYIKNHVNVYLKSIDEGIKSASDELMTEATQCPNARFVLGGYSQGALVMHQLLLNLSDKNDAASQALLRRITATVLIADPGKKSETASMHFGTADFAAQGIKSFLTFGERDVPTPSSTYDICNLGDIVCDFSWPVLVDSAGFNVHTKSYQNNQMVRNIGSEIATTLLQQLPGVVDHLDIAPATMIVPPGTPQAYTATAMDPANKPLGDVTAGTTFGISPEGSCVGAVCTASAPGSHTVTGVMNGVIGTATLNIHPIPAGLTGVRSIIAGYSSAYALKSDGTVWAWGHNYSGELGNGTTTDSAVPVQVVGLTGVQNISAKGFSAFALKTDGTVWAWGYNLFGQLGNGTSTDSSVPVRVTGLTGVQNVATEGSTGFALKTDGTVWSWGNNSSGELGNGTTTNSSVPVQVTGLTGVQSITSGPSSAYAVKTDGTAWAWGWNNIGQLGNGTTTDSSVPVQVTGLTGVHNITTDSQSASALKADGTVWAWGFNLHGELGNGTTTDSSVPVQVTGLTGVQNITTEGFSSFAVKKDGTVWAWGYNLFGELGNGTTIDSSVPVQVTGLTGVQNITTGGLSAFAMKTDGTVWAWGSNNGGVLGNGTTSDSSIPVQVTGLTGVQNITTGAYSTFALKTDGTVWSWGYNFQGQLGNGTTTDSSVPVQVG